MVGNPHCFRILLHRLGERLDGGPRAAQHLRRPENRQRGLRPAEPLDLRPCARNRTFTLWSAERSVRTNQGASL